jgi:hypothetical protein
VDLWWSGKHANHGGNIQVITAPDGWPLWTSDVRPGREHDTTALREHPDILPALTTWIAENRPALGDLGYEGESDTITVAVKRPKGRELTDEQKDHNKAHNGKLGTIVAAALGNLILLARPSKNRSMLAERPLCHSVLQRSLPCQGTIMGA